jgi:hypothetical protein
MAARSTRVGDPCPRHRNPAWVGYGSESGQRERPRSHDKPRGADRETETLSRDPTPARRWAQP